jgi:oligoendopeptidase F
MMKYKTKWDLGHIYSKDYKEESAKDLASIKKTYLTFGKKYRKDKKHLKNPKALARAIEEYEELSKNPAAERPDAYFSYRTYLNSEDNEAQAEIAKISQFYADLANEVEFFMLEIGKIPKGLQKSFLKSQELKPFRYFLKKIFDNAKYNLSEAEEKILNLKAVPARGMWVSGFSKLLSKQTVNFEDEELPIAEAFAKIPTLETSKRRALHQETMKVLQRISDFSESEINAVVTDKKINDKLRGFKIPYEATVKGYENDLKTVEDLVETVTKNFEIAHEFYRIKAEMLGEKKLSYADRAAQVAKTEIKVPFEEAVGQVIRTFNGASPEFGNFVEDMLAKGLVDVFPQKGKHGGAFCSNGINVPIYVLLNHVENFHSLTTLAHEMGHGIHFKYSKKQRPIYEDVTIATAEVASTFFENLVFEEALQNVSTEEKITLLHDKIQDDISTIFRQIACFNFEKELHETIRKEGFLSKEKIAELMNKHMQSYLGSAFELAPEDGYFFVNWSHIRNFFYVYSYAFGQIISDALYQRYKADKSKIKDVIEFLSSGSSDSPENIFKKIGIKTDKKLFESGLNRVKSNIDELKKLWRQSRK